MKKAFHGHKSSERRKVTSLKFGVIRFRRHLKSKSDWELCLTACRMVSVSEWKAYYHLSLSRIVFQDLIGIAALTVLTFESATPRIGESLVNFLLLKNVALPQSFLILKGK